MKAPRDCWWAGSVERTSVPAGPGRLNQWPTVNVCVPFDDTLNSAGSVPCECGVSNPAREAQVQTTCTSQALSIQGKNRRSSAIKRGNTNGMAVTRSTRLSGRPNDVVSTNVARGFTSPRGNRLCEPCVGIKMVASG